MKTYNFFKLFFIGLIFLSQYLSAQNSTTIIGDPLRQGYYTFGINGGLAYQSSDVKSQPFDGFGLGLTLAKNYYYRPGSWMRFDLRGRLLYSQSYGADSKANYGIQYNNALNGTPRFGDNFSVNYLDANASKFVFNNHKTYLGEFGLEGVLMFNRLRERTKWVVSLYGGINLDWYNVCIDQMDGTGLYSSKYLNALNTGNTSVTTLESFRDGLYETVGDGFNTKYGKLRIMPSLGLEVGRELMPHFIVGVGHKINFTGVDNFDGQKWENNNTASTDKDLHHYTYLQLLWEFNAHQKKLSPPIIEFVQPEYSPYISNSQTFEVIANVKNVNSAADVQMNVNENGTAFNFSKAGRLSRTIQLRKGSNEVVIKASNLAGSDQKSVTIIYNETAEPEIGYPTVRFTNPPSTPYTVQQSSFVINADATNISSNQDVSLFINGRSIPANYDNRNRVISASTQLVEGTNNVRVVVKNKKGQAEANATINYEKRIDRPDVRFTNPSYSPFETDNNFISLRAKTTNVGSRNDIQYEVNGNRSSDFNFDANRGDWTASIRLREGENNIRLNVFNNSGSAEDNVVIIYRRVIVPPPPPPPTQYRPTVKITNIDSPVSENGTCRSNIRATIRNVEKASDIQFIVNGRSISNFNYSAYNESFSATAILTEGNNSIKIRASNRAGSDEDNGNVNGCKKEIPIVAPVVTITDPSEISKTVETNNYTLTATVINVNSSNEISLKVNGSPQSFNYNSYSKVLTSNLNLVGGGNSIVLKATNNGGSDQKTVDLRYLKAPVVLRPIVKIEQPANESTTTNSTVDFKGKATNIGTNDIIELTLNDKKIQNVSINKVNKMITNRITLDEGKNVIKLFGKNQAGSDEASVVIYKEKIKEEIPKPVIQFIVPNVSGTKTTNSLQDIVATVKNVNSENNIQVTNNGRNTRFSYNPANNTITLKVSLNEGPNIVLISATNSAGKTNAETMIIKEASVQKPVVLINSVSTPVASPRKPEVGASSFIGNAKNVSVAQISLIVNNKPITNFNYNATTGVINCTIELIRGTNNIKLSATNAAGTDEKTTVVNF